MNLLLPQAHSRNLSEALSEAGRREVGGILMGQHLRPEVFRVADLTIQKHSGKFAAFVRALLDVMEPLRQFFEATRHDYTQFNYLGEWHSHHSFELVPSDRDRQSMRRIVDDPGVGANFAVLMLVKLGESSELLCRAWLYRSEVDEEAVEVHIEP